ncbi:hypothetical protein BD410DRAFT_793306 [Rickenella mellea]|uniref:G domain-containing protein n=1 Tax=Rickenella mellea TaxID=50990 RepID=A0A4Y7PSP9_9AGAM|nr:hypothetical protein BD410DRAFT_793306 [Rickenella mellea]
MTPDSTKIVLVMGPTGTGKTSFINAASKSDFPVSDDLNSCTKTVDETKPFIVGSHNVVLVDTPGLGHSHIEDLDVLRPIAEYLETAYSRNMQLSGIVYMHPFPDPRIEATARQYFRVFCKLWGVDNLKHVTVVLPPPNGIPNINGPKQHLIPSIFQPVVKAGGRIINHDFTHGCTKDILRAIVARQSVVLKIQHELVDLKKSLRYTDAGAALSSTRKEDERSHRSKWKVHRLLPRLFGR